MKKDVLEYRTARHGWRPPADDLRAEGPAGVPAARENWMIERRKNPRLKVVLPLDYSPIVERKEQEGTIFNATEGGILVFLREAFQPGELIRVKIFASSDSELHTIEAIAKVVWKDPKVNETSGLYRYGLELQSFFKGDLNKFKALLRGVEQDSNTQGPGSGSAGS